MPYICLANSTIPDGVVQINDLLPNVSLASATISAPGQNRYVNRAQNDTVKVNTTTGKSLSAAKGLSAYLMDRVVPGGNTAPTGTITLTGVLTGDVVTVAGVGFTAVLSGATASAREFNAGAPTATVTCASVSVDDTVTIQGVVFTAKAALDEDIPNQLWSQAGDDTADAARLVLAINHANAQALITAALGGGLTITATSALGVVTLTGGTTAVALDSATLATSNGTRLAKSGTTLDYPNTATATSLAASINNATPQGLLTTALGGSGRTIAAVAGTNVVTLTAGGTAVQYAQLGTLASTHGTREALSGTALNVSGGGAWTHANLTTAAANLQARVDAGLSLTVSNVNTVLAAVVANTSLTAGSSTDGSITDILEIMAGREYYLPAASQVYNATYLPLTVKSAAQGGFTRDVTVWDSQMVQGELRPVAATGDTVAYDRKGIRPTVDSSSFQLSLAGGVLNQFAAGVTLLPDSDEQVPISWTYQKTAGATNVANQRLVTVYDDDGSLLA